MKVLSVFALCLVACQGFVLPATTLVRAPAHDSAHIRSDRLGGNFAYSVEEGHAYAAVSPVVQHVATPVAVSYETPAVRVAPFVHHAVPVTVEAPKYEVKTVEVPKYEVKTVEVPSYAPYGYGYQYAAHPIALEAPKYEVKTVEVPKYEVKTVEVPSYAPYGYGYAAHPITVEAAAPLPLAAPVFHAAPAIVDLKAPVPAGDAPPMSELVQTEKVLAPVRAHSKITPEVTVQLPTKVNVEKVAVDVPVATPYAHPVPVPVTRHHHVGVATHHHISAVPQAYVSHTY